MPKILYNPEVLKHRPKFDHVENPERVEIILNSLKLRGFNDIILIEGKSSIDEVLEIHSKDYVDSIVKLCNDSFNYYDGDTYISNGTLDAALTAFKLAKEAVKLALKEKDLYFALTRPPGHHAGISGRALGAMSNGFCIFNNIAGAARLAKNYMKRVIIIDFDVHHGNGTQEIFWDDENIIHVDFHQKGIYPGTGDVLDIGGKEAEGTKINIPFPAHSTDSDYIFAWNEIVEPILNYFKPEIILISAGFDAFINDGLANMDLTETFYRFVGAKLSKYRAVAVLEGGYGIGLKYGAPAFLEGYVKAGEISDDLDSQYKISPSSNTKSMVENIKKIVKEFLIM